MAEEPYIKMRKKLRHDPRVVALASRLQRSRAEIIGGLFLLWCLGDEHGEILRGLTKPLLDLEVGIPGFSDALPPEWLQERVTKLRGNVTAALHLPNYVGHNATTERTRALTRERVRKHREKQAKACNGVTALHDPPDQTRPEPEETRKQPPPTVDDARALAGYAAECCFTNPGAVEVGKLLKVFGPGTVVTVFEHLASRDPGHWDSCRNPLALVRSLCNQVRDGDALEAQGDAESFADWRARAEARVSGKLSGVRP